MDSLTQMTLGACVGAAVGGRKYGKKSALMGAIIGTTPDLDVFFGDYENPIKSMTTHRGFSHSFLFVALATPALAFIASYIKPLKVSIRDWQIYALIFLGLLTHILLDAVTIYGTQLFWPTQIAPVAIGSLFIIDLAYTLPLLIGVIWFLFSKSPRPTHIGLVISTLYVLWSLGAQYSIKNMAKDQLASNNVNYERILVQPTPFNTLLWRVLVVDENDYKVGYYSVFDENNQIDFATYSSNSAYKEKLGDSYAVSRMNWFTKGLFDIRQNADQLILADLRMGLEPDQYVFQFIIAENQNGEFVEIPNQHFDNERDLSRLALIWDRIWDEDAMMTQIAQTEKP